jgi:diacylglycerol kinase (ATP)
MGRMRDIILLHNPGSRRAARTARDLRVLLSSAGSAVGRSLRWVAISDLEQAAAIPERMIVVGGDGTINAAASWLESRGAGCPLAVIPAGTGNNLARGFGIPLKLEEALKIALHGGEIRSLDAVIYRTGTAPAGAAPAGAAADTRLMVQIAALGFPADMAGVYDRLRRNVAFRVLAAPAGTYVYRILGLVGLIHQKRREKAGKNVLQVRLELPGEIIQEQALALFFCNERSLGGNFFPCPLARVDDGLLDICLVRAGTGMGHLKLFRRVARGTHLSLESAVIYRQTMGPVEVEISTPKPLLVDGDLWVKSSRFSFEMLPGRFQVVVA